MKIFEDAFGWLFYKMHIIYERYVVKKAIVGCAGFGKNSKLNYPCRFVGYNKYTKTKYIHIGNGVSFGANSTIFATRAHLYIGDKSFSGPNLTKMTGDHPFDIKGKYIADNRKIDIEMGTSHNMTKISLLKTMFGWDAMLLFLKGFILAEAQSFLLEV